MGRIIHIDMSEPGSYSGEQDYARWALRTKGDEQKLCHKCRRYYWVRRHQHCLRCMHPDQRKLILGREGRMTQEELRQSLLHDNNTEEGANGA